MGCLSKLKKFYKKEKIGSGWFKLYGNSNGIKFNVLICDPSKEYIAQHFYDLDINLFSVEF
jgi:hypothetical protein